jgi:hypothetical protein
VIDADLVEAAYDDAVTTDDYVHASAVTMSMVGGCRRQAAYALRDGWPDTPSDSSAPAYLGGAIHTRLLPDLARRLEGDVEPEVEVTVEGVRIVGHPDLVLREGECLDLKTVSQFYYAVVKGAVPLDHRLQVTAGALATDCVGCCLLYVNRSDGDRFAVSWDVGEYTADLVTWARDIQHPPDDVPRDERGPVLSFKCDACPWVSQCWGPLDEYRAPQAAVIDEVGIEMALEEYDRARVAESRGRLDKEFWRAALDGYDAGPYGSWELGWTGGGKPAGDVPDYEAAWSYLVDQGAPLPYKRGKPKKPSISVKRRTPEE